MNRQQIDALLLSASRALVSASDLEHTNDLRDETFGKAADVDALRGRLSSLFGALDNPPPMSADVQYRTGWHALADQIREALGGGE